MRLMVVRDMRAKGEVTGQRRNRSLILLVVIVIFKHPLNYCKLVI